MPEVLGGIFLAELVRSGSGICPRCGEMLAPGYTLLLLNEARKADALQYALVLSLQRLVWMPRSLELEPGSSFHAAVAAVAWDELLADDREIICGEVVTLRSGMSAWHRMSHRQRSGVASRIAAVLRRLGQRLRRHGQLLDQRRTERAGHGGGQARSHADAVWHAARHVDDAADAVVGDERGADDIVHAALKMAEASVRDGQQTSLECARESITP